MTVVLLAAALSAAGQPSASDWLGDEGGVLALKLAGVEKGAVCGGTLTVDRNRRLVLWTGAPGDIGCKQKLESPFAEVKSVNAEDNGVFTLEVKSGKVKKLQLVPLPHAAWLMQQPKVRDSMGTTMKYGSSLEGPGGEGMSASGSAAGGGPTVKKLDVPKEVAADTKKAVDAITQALEAPAR